MGNRNSMAGKNITPVVSDIDHIIAKLVAVQERTRQSPAIIDNGVFTRCVSNIHGILNDMEKCFNETIPCALDDNLKNGKILKDFIYCVIVFINMYIVFIGQ